MRVHALIILFFCATVGAQTLVLSPKYAKVDAQGSDQLAGLGATFRQQILISGERLKPLRGKELTGISFRRDAAIGDALTGGSVTFAVALSRGPEDPGQASQMFAANQRSKPILVFNGLVVIPSSPAVANNYNPWGPKNSFHIGFTTGYSYTDGALCIDIVGIHASATGTPFWLIDFEQVDADGTAVAIGRGCADKNGFQGMAMAPTENLRVGSTAQIISLGRSQTTTMFLLGVRHYAPGVSLAPMGAPGCFQHVEPVVVLLVGPYVDLPYASGHAVANVTGKIPVGQGLMGSRLVVQFANNETMLPKSQWTNAAGMTTSNGLALTISSVPPSLGMSMVRSYPSASAQNISSWGVVDVSKGPILDVSYK